MSHYSFFLVELDKVLWDVFGQFYLVVLVQVSVPYYNVLPLTYVADMLHNMIDCIFLWRALHELVLNFCRVPVWSVRCLCLLFNVTHVVFRLHTAGH